jgi:aspartate 1-decarboxylase
MLIEVMRSKLHRVTVTDANKDYIGSCTIDATLLDAAHMGDMERVQVLNVTNGARLETYIIVGERNSGVICLNGAAAHHFKAGDIAIIVAYGLIQSPATVASRTVFVDDKNRITGVKIHQSVR